MSSSQNLVRFILIACLLIQGSQGDICRSAKVLPFYTEDSSEVVFLQNNDCYDLRNLPNEATLLKSYAAETSTPTIFTMTGDFLSPMKRVFDEGKAMVEAFNRMWNGLAIFLFGNHEFDVSPEELVKRIDESNHIWLVSNIQGIDTPENKCIEEYAIITVNDVPVLAIVGLVSNEKKDFSPDVLKRITIEDPFVAAQRIVNQIHSAYPELPIIALTHLSWEEDERLAATGLFTAILGGHDHDLGIRRVLNVPIVKCKEDAEYLCEVNVSYSIVTSANSTHAVPVVNEVTITPIKNEEYEPDPELSAYVAEINEQIQSQTESCIFAIPPGENLTTINSRKEEVSMAKAILSELITIFDADAALFSSGNIRGHQNYSNCCSMHALHAIMPFSSSRPIAVQLPGSVIEEAITYSRRYAFQIPPQENPDFFQVDQGLVYDMEQRKILTIGSKSFDSNAIYKVVINCLVLDGLNDHKPILEYDQSIRSSSSSNFSFCDSSQPSIFDLLNNHYINKSLVATFLSFPLNRMDSDQDGVVSIEEFSGAFSSANSFSLHEYLRAIMWKLMNMPSDNAGITADEYARVVKMLNVTVESPSPDPTLVPSESLWKDTFKPEALHFPSL